MKEGSWEECVESVISVKVSPDRARARSLVETAKARIEFVKGNAVKEENANFIFEAYYSSALEMLHSILVLDGFKVDNHVCAGYYLRDVLKKEALFRIFDDCRFKRNSLIYYGKKADFATAKETILKANKLIWELSLIFEEKMK